MHVCLHVLAERRRCCVWRLDSIQYRRDTYAFAHTNADAHPDTNAHAYPDAHTYTHADSDSDTGLRNGVPRVGASLPAVDRHRYRPSRWRASHYLRERDRVHRRERPGKEPEWRIEP